MLEPDGRHLLLDALRPPPGQTLDQAVGTTYSLDLLTLLTAPVAFAMFDRQRDDGSLAIDPIATLQALRTHARNITIFHQAGQVNVPPLDQVLITYLEDSVYPVIPPHHEAIFHPKVWLLRFRDPESDAVSLRLLCLSRNLTFDRSWDTILRLDGVPGTTASHVELREFTEALLEMAAPRRTMEPGRMDAVRRLGDDMASAIWQLPDGFDEVRFWPIGYDMRERWPFEGRIDRMLVVSPFLTQGAISALTRKRRGSILVSRPESIEKVGGDAVRHLAEVLVLSGEAAAPIGDEHQAAATEAEAAADPDRRLDGLHAKTYVADAGWQGRVWTGSANATDAAFHGNVEFLVELRGRKRICGVHATIGDHTDRLGLRKLVEPYEPPNANPLPDSAEEQLRRRLDAARRAIGAMRYTATCAAAADAEWRLTLTGEPTSGALEPDVLDGLDLTVAPVTITAGSAVVPEMESGLRAAFGPLSTEALTPFFAIRLTAGDLAVAFVVVAELVGAPDGRAERVLTAMLRDTASFIRFLLLLLGRHEDALLDGGEEAGVGSGRGAWLAALGSEALLEPLVRAYARDPDRLRDIDNVIAELRRAGNGDELLPRGWADIWGPIATALAERETP